MGKKRFDYVFEELFEVSEVFSHLYNEVIPDKRITKRELEDIDNYIENKLKPAMVRCQEKIKERKNE
jgi:hypothetical protein